MRVNSIRSASLVLAAATLPTSALAGTCAELQARRDTAITLVNTQNNVLRECLASFPNWRDEAHARYYDTYDVTETIPGKPRRLIISHGRWTSTAYVAPATRTRIERSVEYEDIGVGKRLSLFSPDDQTKISSLGQHMNVALGDEFLLCRGKVDAIGFVQALAGLGWGFQGGDNGVTHGWDEKPFVPQPGFRTVPGAPDADEIRMPLSQRAINRCLQRDENAAHDAAAPARQVEANEAHRKFMEEQRRKVEERDARRRAGNWD